MFQEGNYDVLEFSVPPQGMNQNIDPNSLPSSFAYVLENIIPNPLGSGRVRFGTRAITSLLNPESRIMKIMPYATANGNQQALIYAQELAQDGAAGTFMVLTATTFSFVSVNHALYTVDTRIKIIYTLNGTRTIYTNIVGVTVVGTTVTITLNLNTFPLPLNAITIQSVWYSTGTIYSYDFSTDTLSAALKQNLSVTCIPRYITFQNILVIYNGVDRAQQWDGVTLQDLVDYVKEGAQNFVRINNTHFSFTIPANFDANKYANNNLIHLDVDGVISNLTATNVAVVAQTATITTAQNLPAFAGGNTVQLFYRDWPPTFNYMKVLNDRIYALGTGAASIQYRVATQALVLYYQYLPNSLTGWFNEQTKLVPFIDVSAKHGIADNLEALTKINEYIAIVGRNRTQIWIGDISLNNFSWYTTLGVGVPHGDLLIELDNDTFFISSTGLKSINTLNIANQLAAVSYDAVNPLIREYLQDIFASNIDYWQTGSFKYKEGAFAGFKIGRNKILTSLYATTLYAWSIFSGDFSKSACIVEGVNNNLYLGLNNSLIQYADGIDGQTPFYGDNNNTALINFSWVLPISHLKGKRFANKFYELQVDYPSSFTINTQNQIQINITGDLPKTFRISKICALSPRGDVLGTIPLAVDNNPNALGFRLGISYNYIKQRLKFIASRFWISINGYAMNGEVSFKRIRLFGIGERNG